MKKASGEKALLLIRTIWSISEDVFLENTESLQLSEGHSTAKINPGKITFKYLESVLYKKWTKM